MLFKGGSNAWSHTHLDLNSFFIAAGGERLATDPGPEPYSVHLWHSVMPAVSTAWHNCIVVDGAHQRMAAQYAMSLDLEEAGDCYSRLSDHLSSEFVEMIRGDATSAYADTLERAWRDIVYLKPDVFVIFDDLRAKPARVQRGTLPTQRAGRAARDMPGRRNADGGDAVPGGRGARIPAAGAVGEATGEPRRGGESAARGFPSRVCAFARCRSRLASA